ncbi:MAG: hypothetical protein AB7Q37_13505 [Pyrinomonadaceae bacterium]
MAVKKPRKKKKGLFETIRKPTAPSSKKFGLSKREDKLDRVGRKTKHKKDTTETVPDADL